MTDAAVFCIWSMPRGGRDCVVKARGDIDLHNAARFQDTLLDALIASPNRIIVDLADVAHIDATGVDVLLSARQRAYEQGTTLTVRGPSSTIVPILEQNGVDPSWETGRAIETAWRETRPEQIRQPDSQAG